MNPEELEGVVKAVTDGVAEKTAEAVENAVKTETESLKKEVEDLKEEMKEVATKSKFSTTTREEAEELNKQFVVETFKNAIQKKMQFEDAVDTAKKTLTEGTAGSGLELVFDQFENDIQRVINSYELLQHVKIISLTKGDKLTIPKATNGITTAWIAEVGIPTASQPTTANISIDIEKAVTLTDMSTELLEDTMTTPDLYAMIVELIGEDQAEFLENQILNGDGIGSNFDGVYNNSSVNVVTMDALDVSVTNVSDTYLNRVEAAVSKKYKRNKASIVFEMSQYTFNLIRSMKTTTGAILYPELRMSSPTLLGYNVLISDNNPVQSVLDDGVSKKFISFGDYKYFTLVMRKDISIERGFYGNNWRDDIASIKSTRRLGGSFIFAEALAVLSTAAA